MFGVDKAAYFLHEQKRLTRASMFEAMGSYDEGCAKDGGTNTIDVFLVSRNKK